MARPKQIREAEQVRPVMLKSDLTAASKLPSPLLQCCSPKMRERLYFVHIMASLSGVLYIGVTSDLQTRVRQHKAGTFEGFSKHYRCYRLVHCER
jgi:hypothetical protein